jgi:uncharacterized protein (DUF1697 family)
MTLIALFRGINVVGKKLLPMRELKTLLEKNGCTAVRTYIQSGNVVFCSRASDTRRLAKRIRAAVGKRFGFEPHVLLLTTADLKRAAAGNPFPEANGNPTTVHLFFLDEPPKRADLKSCEALKTSERFALKGRVFYLHTPDGFGQSKLASRAERFLGVNATARNWNTVSTVLEMVQERPDPV